MTSDEALRELFGTDVYDVTAEGLAAALSDLRRRDKRRAQQVQRSLKPWLRERGIFPRRRVPWYATSQGLRARIALLPDNPHLEEDIRVVRQTLGIPADQLRAAPDSTLRRRIEEFFEFGGHPLTEEPPPVLRRTVVVSSSGRPLETAAQAADRNLSGQWLWCHRCTALGQPLDFGRDCPNLPPAAVRSAQASAVLDLASVSEPAWLHHQPRDSGPLLQSGVPIDRAVALLIERHRLPVVSWVAGGLALYVVTDDSNWVSHGSFPATLAELGARHGINPASDDSFGLAVAGLDEFVTRADWDAIWDHLVRPRQQLLRQLAGRQPQGRLGHDLTRLVQGMPLYREVVLHGGTVEGALSRLNDQEHPAAHVELSAARALMQDLALLLTPVDE